MYIIITTDKQGNDWIMERKLSDAESWDETVSDIKRGEWRDISKVIRTSDGQDVLPLMQKWIDYKLEAAE